MPSTLGAGQQETGAGLQSGVFREKADEHGQRDGENGTAEHGSIVTGCRGRVKNGRRSPHPNAVDAFLDVHDSGP